jgi:hypothetical protein
MKRGIPSRRQLACVVLSAGAAMAGCFTSKICSLIGCQDQFHATIANTNGSFPSGTQVLDVTADGVTVSCTFQVPPATAQPGGSTVAPECPSGLRVFIAQATTCTPTQTGSTTSLGCVPIAGHFFEDVTVSGKPAQLRVRLTVDGAVALDRSETPVYHASQPNGPGCEPICQQASADWTFAASP